MILGVLLIRRDVVGDRVCVVCSGRVHVRSVGTMSDTGCGPTHVVLFPASIL